MKKAGIRIGYGAEKPGTIDDYAVKKDSGEPFSIK